MQLKGFYFIFLVKEYWIHTNVSKNIARYFVTQFHKKSKGCFDCANHLAASYDQGQGSILMSVPVKLLKDCIISINSIFHVVLIIVLLLKPQRIWIYFPPLLYVSVNWSQSLEHISTFDLDVFMVFTTFLTFFVFILFLLSCNWGCLLNV